LHLQFDAVLSQLSQPVLVHPVVPATKSKSKQETCGKLEGWVMRGQALESHSLCSSSIDRIFSNFVLSRAAALEA
jgi:hypothetical protein